MFFGRAQLWACSKLDTVAIDKGREDTVLAERNTAKRVAED